jgi:hypothetical protein
MYNDYQIISVDTTEKCVTIRFTAEGRRAYVTQRHYSEDLEISDDLILELVKHAQPEAYSFYQQDQASEAYVPESWNGSLKPLVLEDFPDYNPNFEKLEEVWSETDENRTRTFNISPLSDHEIESRVKRKRTMLLEESDIEGLTDRTMSVQYKEYRQKLRDITDQEGYPRNIIWPVKPIG